MKQITVTLNVDEEVIRNETKDTGATTLDEAISQELGWLHDSGMNVESWSYTEPEKEKTQLLSAEESPELCNTKIMYLYRDADNYKMMNECVIEGALSKEQLHMILNCLQDGEYFIPSQVGLPEKRFGEITESDHCWFELNEYSFLVTPDAPTVQLNVEALVQAFCDRKNRWDDTLLLETEEERTESYKHVCDGTSCLEFKRETAKLSLSDQIHSGANRSMNFQSEHKISLKNPDKER